MNRLEKWLFGVCALLIVAIVVCVIMISAYEDLTQDKDRQIDQLQQELNNCREKFYFYDPSEENGGDSAPTSIASV